MNKTMVAIAAVALAVPGMAAAQDAPIDNSAAFDGARIEARIGYETPTVSGDGDVYKIGSAVSAGGEVGYDVAVGRSVVVGPYATYEFSSVKLCDAGDCLKVDGNLGVGGRIGFAAGSTTQIYGKLGYARITLSADFAGLSDSESKSGIQGGLGVAFNFGRNFYGMVEGSYADYGKLYGINLQRRHVAAGVGVRF